MKSLKKITIALILFTLGNLQLTAQNRNTTSIEGSGNVITKTVTTRPYNIINVQGSMEVYLISGKEGTIKVIAEDNVQDRIIVESDGNTLTISMKNNTSLRNTQRIKITVPFEDLTELSMIGSGEITGKDIIQSDLLKLSLKGSGEMQLYVETDNIVTELNGSGEVKISGKSKNVKTHTIGSGEFKGKELFANQAEINISGSGSSSIFVNDSLSGEIRGSGEISYGGNPTINNVKVVGSGKLKSL